MATLSGDGANNGGGIPGPDTPQGTQPMFTVLVQYTKDFSFENPNAPQSLIQQAQPQVGYQINVNEPRQLSATDYEVELKVEGKVETGGNVLYAFDLRYAGVFRLLNIRQEDLGPLLLIECPRLLFPYAREIISNAVANGGFPPLLLPPVDFVGHFQQKMAELQAAQQQAAQA
jgi:preprotein translocase subunit SecB